MQTKMFLALLEKIAGCDSTLSLQNCQLNLLDDEQILAVRKKIKAVGHKIRYINLSGNDLANFAEINIPSQYTASDDIKLLACVSFLRSFNKLFTSFRYCRDLQAIDFSNCNLGGQILNSKFWNPENEEEFFSECLFPLLPTSLIRLNLQHNNLGPQLKQEKLKVFIDAFSQFFELKTLDLRNNKFSSEQIQAIKSEYGKIIKEDLQTSNKPTKSDQSLLEPHLHATFGTRDEFRDYAKSKGFRFFAKRAEQEKIRSSDDNLIVYEMKKL